MKYKTLSLLLLFFVSFNVYSFQEEGPPPPTIPPPVGLPASINDMLLFLIISAIVLGFFILTKKKMQ